MYQAKRNLSGHNISKQINLSPPAIKPRLTNLQQQGIIKPFKTGRIRTFKRTFGTIKAPSKILWGIDIKDKTLKRKRNKLF